MADDDRDQHMQRANVQRAKDLFTVMETELSIRRVAALPPGQLRDLASVRPPCARVYQGLAMYAALRVEGMDPASALQAAAQQVVDHLLSCGE